MKNLYSLSIAEALKGLEEKEFSSKELTTSVLERIKATDNSVNAYITVKEDAIEDAQKADEKRGKEEKNKYPLLGIPFSLKDNICTTDAPTTASSKVLEGYIPQYQATIVEKLKKAGAIIIGKTNMDAWAHGSSTETSDFFTTKNPWDIKKLPGGSSGGTAATVAADMTIGGIGTETAGSIRHPASWCGVVGFKPTYGRVSRYGIIAMGSSLDSPGPMSKTIEDAAITLETIAGHDPNDATSSKKPTDEYTKIMKKDIKGMRIGLSTECLSVSDKKIQEKILEAIKVLEKLGAKITEVKLLDPKYSISVYTILQRAEVSSNLARFDGIRYGKGREYFGAEAKRRIMLGTYALSTGYYDALYIKAQKIRTLIVDDFNKVFKDVDVVIGPTTPCTALPLGSTKTSPMFGELQDVLVEPSTIAGLPGVNMPAGFVENLPVGMQIIGPQFEESRLFQIAAAYEKNTEWHTKKPNI